MLKRLFRSRAFLIITPIAIVVVLAGYAVALRQAAKMDVRKFVGTIRSIEGNEFIVLRGTFYPVPSAVPKEYQGERDFRFRIADSTKYFGVVRSVPIDQILSQTGIHVLKGGELPKKEGPGSLDEIKNLSGKGITSVEVSFPYPILQRNDPVAEFVLYRHMPYILPDEEWFNEK